MNDQERQVISEIFERLEQVADQPRDPEAERFIQDRIRRQPYAPYAMAQAIVVQEQALKNLNEQLEALAAENEELRSRPQGGFLSSIFGGGWARVRAARVILAAAAGGPWGQPGQQPQPGPGQGAPWGGQPGMGQPMGQPGMGQPGMAQPGMGGPFGAPQGGGGGFLGTALSTAAGVAGGMMLGSALSNAFKGSGGHGAMGGGLGGGQAGAGGNSDFSDLSPFGNSGSTGASGNAAFQDSGNDDASLQDASFDQEDDFGGDAAGDLGGDDWA